MLKVVRANNTEIMVLLLQYIAFYVCNCLQYAVNVLRYARLKFKNKF